MGFSSVAKTPVSHGVEPHDLETVGTFAFVQLTTYAQALAATAAVWLSVTAAGERPRAKFPARSTPIACSATSFKTNHPTRVWSHLYRLPTSGLRSILRGANAAVMGAMRGRIVVERASPRRRRRGVARKGRSNLSVPQHAQEAHGCRLLPHRSFGSSPEATSGRRLWLTADPTTYFSSLSKTIANKSRWSIDPNGVELGFYSFSKLLMIRDLEPGSPGARSPSWTTHSSALY